MSSVTSTGGTEEKKHFGQVRTRCSQGKKTYFPTGLFGCDLSLRFRHRPHRRQLLPGIHPRAQRSPGRGGRREERLYQPGRGGAKTRIRGSRGTRGSDLPAPAPRTRDSEVRGALKTGCSGDHSPRAARSCAAPSPPRAPLLRPLGTHRLLSKSGLCTGRLARRPPGPPIGSQPAASAVVGAGRGARKGASSPGGRGGAGWEGRGAGCPSQATAPPRPRPAAVAWPKWDGPVCAPPVGSGYLAICRKACKQGAWLTAHASSGANRKEERASASGRVGEDGGGHRELVRLRSAAVRNGWPELTRAWRVWRQSRQSL